MAFKNAQQSRVMLGKLNLSGYTRSISAPSTVDMLDVTTLADTAKTFIPGMNTSTFSVDLLLDTDTTSGGEWDVVTTWKGTPQVLSYFPSGLTAGSECLLVQANEGSMAPSASVGDAVGMSIATQTDGGTDAVATVPGPQRGRRDAQPTGQGPGGETRRGVAGRGRLRPGRRSSALRNVTHGPTIRRRTDASCGP